MNKGVTQEEKIFIKRILERAARVLSVNLDSLQIEFGDTDGCFETIENAAISNDIPYLFIKINIDWFRVKRNAGDLTAIRDILYHEMRHIYQFNEIVKYKNNQPSLESKETILNWINNRKYYVSYSSEDKTTHIPHFSQSIELDAMSFSVVLRLLDIQNGDNIQNGVAIPDEIWPLVNKRVYEICKHLGLV